MTVKEAINRADGLRMNTVSQEQKAAWVLDLDGQLAEIDAVDAAQVARVAESLLRPGALAVAALGTRKGSEIRPEDLA